MIRRLVDQAFNSGKYYISAVGLSTDVKPTEGIITGSKFVEVDTGIGYLFDETAGEWHENQQLSAAVQAYFEDHPEAIDQAAIEAMFGDQLDGIEEDIGGLKSAIDNISEHTKNLIVTKKMSATPVNVTVDSNGDGTFYVHGTANSNGGRTTKVSELITIPPGTYTLSSPYASAQRFTAYLNDSTTNDNFAGVTVGGTLSTFTINSAKTFYVGFGFLSGTSYDLTAKLQLESGSSATDFIPSVTAYDIVARNNVAKNTENIEKLQEIAESGVDIEEINFKKTTLNLFTGYFEPNIRINSSGEIVEEISPNIAANRDYVEVSAETGYCFYERQRINYPGTFNVIISYYNSSKTFLSQENKANAGSVKFTTPANTKYIRIYLYKANIGDYLDSWEFVLCAGNDALPSYVPPYVIKKEYVEQGGSSGIADVLVGKSVLIFGDSITDCCDITVNASNQTTAYSFRNPSNSYTNASSQTVSFSMWPKILRANKSLFDVRNYAKFGATYKDGTPSTGNERQNVSYQITVAENDISNPNSVFPTVGNYKPDIVIFALGTNDGAPNDTPSSAYNKLVRDADATINVQSSLANMDRTKFCEAVLWAFLKVKSLFPLAQCFCVTPLQSANRNTIPGLLHDYIKEIAERYNYIVIDGSYTSGITRELNNADTIGEYLIDGLHPNEKGQNFMARMIISALERNYMSFDGTGFNTIS